MKSLPQQLTTTLNLAIFILSFLFYSTNTSAHRLTQLFNDDWQFLHQSDIKTAHDGQWQSVDIPHTWNQDAYHQWQYDRSAYWYRKIFTIPVTMINKELYLRFDAVNSFAEVYLNGHLLNIHSGGYTAFMVHLPKNYLNNSNILTVKVDNRNINIPPLNGDFTIFGGIYRYVHLIALNPIHFDMDNYGSSGIFISTPQISKSLAKVEISGRLKNPKNIPLDIKVSLLDEKKLVASTQLTKNNSGNWNTLPIEIQDPKLWSPGSPHLYKAIVQIVQGEIILDEITQSVGLRWFSVDTKNGFMLNGEPLKLLGTNRHQDQYPYGIAVPQWVHYRDVHLIKSMGANFLRLAHYPQDETVLHLCDSLGLIVWEEIPIVDIIADNVTFRINCETQLKEMVRQHYNHPSVVFWGYMNETINQVYYRVAKEEWQSYFKKTVELAKHLEDLLKQEDKSRLSVMACGGSTVNNDIGLTEVTDVMGWNLYQGWYVGGFSDFEKYTDEDFQKYPDRPMIISEFGAGSDQRLHSLRPETFDFSIEYQQLYMEHYLPEIVKRKYIIGAAEWNFIDFNVATRQESMPQTNNKGLVYNDRTPKDIYYYYQAFLRKDTAMVHIASDDWKKRNLVNDGDSITIPLKVYSNQPFVQLKVNGKWLAKKEIDNCHAIWNIQLSGGKNSIQAIGLDAHQNTAFDSMTIQVAFSPLSTSILKEKKWDLGINVGSNCSYFDASTGVTWHPDQPYNKGSWGYLDGSIFRRNPGRIGTTATIGGTDNTPLYQTMRQDISAYQIDAPPGQYEIELHFADLFPSSIKAATLEEKSLSPEVNTFDIVVNGKLYWSGFSPYILSQGKANSAIKRTISFKNTNHQIRIEFVKRKGHSFLNVLRIKQI